MRIVSGVRRGLALNGPQDRTIRPTSDRARQVIFDILAHAPWAQAHRVRGAILLDAFAGTGALGLEGLSRGASHCHFMEVDRTARRVLDENIARFRQGSACTVISCDSTMPPNAAHPCDIAFLDPPYGRGLIAQSLTALIRAGWITAHTLIVAESEKDGVHVPHVTPYDTRMIGIAQVTFWSGADGQKS